MGKDTTNIDTCAPLGEIFSLTPVNLHYSYSFSKAKCNLYKIIPLPYMGIKWDTWYNACRRYAICRTFHMAYLRHARDGAFVFLPIFCS